MNFDVSKRTILLVRHGSHAYGLNVPTSDEDYKGVCVKSRSSYFGFTERFEQMEHMGSKSDGIDKVVYSIDKFAALAADCNPNIIEVLHVADEDVLVCDEFGEELRAQKYAFLSKKAKFTFSGYAFAQLKRIKTHRKWLLDPPKAPPARKDFGLSETVKVSKSELGAYDSMVDQNMQFDLPNNVIELFTKEKAYQAAKMQYDQYLNWLKTRNPARAELESKFGYDTKHGMHLCRLQMMAIKILRNHQVQVKWSGAEREQLMNIRLGLVSYDELVERSEQFELMCNELYETSTLQREPNRNKLSEFIVDLTTRYLCKHG